MTTKIVNVKGFTLVEIIIVVVILATLAALVIPRLGEAAADPDLSALAATLQMVRTQLQYYQVQHDGKCPAFVDWQQQMLSRTNTRGKLKADGTCGPYLLQIPLNPIDGFKKISPIRDGSGGWAYDEKTGLFQSNDRSVLEPNSPSRDL